MDSESVPNGMSETIENSTNKEILTIMMDLSVYLVFLSPIIIIATYLATVRSFLRKDAEIERGTRTPRTAPRHEPEPEHEAHGHMHSMAH
jgi:hypothetical protein